MSYENEQHLRGVDPLCDLAYCAASNLANIVPPKVSRGVDPTPVIESSRRLFDMGVDRINQLGVQLGVSSWPESVGGPIEAYYGQLRDGEDPWFTQLSGSVLPAALIASAEIPTVQGGRLLGCVEAAIVTDRIAGAPRAQSAILNAIRPEGDPGFGPEHDLYQGYLDTTMYHYPSRVFGGIKGVVRGAVGIVEAARFVAAESEPPSDSHLRTFGY